MNVIIYSKPDCNECTKAKMLLSSKGINYRELKLNEDFTRDTLAEMFPAVRSFPVIVVDNYNIGGYNSLQTMLNEQVNESRKFLTEG